MPPEPESTPQPASSPAAQADQTESIGSHVRTLSGVTLLSRFTGLARDLVTARVFGDTAVGSAFAAAFLVPNTFRRLFGEGALSAAFLPPYTRLADEDEGTGQNQAGPFARVVLLWLAFWTGAITITLELALLGVLLLFPGSPDRTLSLQLMMVALPFMPLICSAAILGGMLQAHRKFAVWAAAPIILNACILATALPALWLTDIPASTWAFPITASTLIAGGLQVGWSVWALRPHVQWASVTRDARSRARVMLRRMVPALIGLGTLQLNTLTDTLIAMYPNWVGPTVAGRDYPLDEASNSILFFAQRLYQFPLGVFGIAVATAAFPALSRAASDSAAFSSVLRRGIRLSLFIGLPASAGLLLVRDDLVTVLYSSPGNAASGTGFSADGLARASTVLMMYAGAVWAYSLNQLFTRAFYAKDDTTTPMRVALWTVAINLVLNLVLIWRFREAGLALATAITAALQTLLLAIMLRRKRPDTHATDPGNSPWRGLASAIALTLAMVAAVLATQHLLSGPGWNAALLRLLTATGLGGGTYLALAALTKRPELRWLLQRSTVQ